MFWMISTSQFLNIVEYFLVGLQGRWPVERILLNVNTDKTIFTMAPSAIDPRDKYKRTVKSARVRTNGITKTTVTKPKMNKAAEDLVRPTEELLLEKTVNSSATMETRNTKADLHILVCSNNTKVLHLQHKPYLHFVVKSDFVPTLFTTLTNNFRTTMERL